jgi:lipid-A-disaccharide synthase
LDEAFCRRAQVDFRRIVGILPGSRNHEVEANFPLQIGVMEQVAARHPDVQFLVACYKERHLERCRQLLATRPRSLPVELFVGRTPEIIESSDCCVMVSGSVSLEMLARAKPAVVHYRANPLTYALVRPLVSVNSITLPNLIAGRRLLPEWLVVLRPDRTVRAMAAVVNEWIASPFKLAQAARDLRQLRQEIGQPGATGRAADRILGQLTSLERAQAA